MNRSACTEANVMIAQWILLLIAILLVYTVVVYVLWRGGILDRFNITLWGPVLMWRTKRGRNFIERLARLKRFWRAYGSVGIVMVFVLMIFMFLLMVESAYIVSVTPDVQAMEAQEVLAIPGLNPMIPFWFGIIGLAIAIIVHEFAHGILSRVANIKVRSLGLLLCVIPIGAFVEPDEEELLSAKRRHRTRVFAVGPWTNVVVGLIFAAIFSWGMIGSLAPIEDGVFIDAVIKDTPANQANITPGVVITHMEEIGNASNSVTVDSYDDFHRFLQRAEAGAPINLTVNDHGERIYYPNIVLMNKYDYPDNRDDNGSAFLGVQAIGLNELQANLHRPVTGADSIGEGMGNLIYYGAVLPITGVVPLHEPLTDYYEPAGGWGLFPEPAFWFLANTFYYIFWLNVLVGTFNVLPAVPLDGGYIFKDGVGWLVEKFTKNITQRRRELYVKMVSRTIAFTVLFLIIWVLIYPRL